MIKWIRPKQRTREESYGPILIGAVPAVPAIMYRIYLVDDPYSLAVMYYEDWEDFSNSDFISQIPVRRSYGASEEEVAMAKGIAEEHCADLFPLLALAHLKKEQS